MRNSYKQWECFITLFKTITGGTHREERQAAISELPYTWRQQTVTLDDPQKSGVVPAPQRHRFHPEPSFAPRDEVNMRSKTSTWMRQPRTMKSGSQRIAWSQMCFRTYRVGTGYKKWFEYGIRDRASTNLNIAILKYQQAFFLPRCGPIHLVPQSPEDVQERVKGALCHWPVTCHRLSLAVKRALSCLDYYVRCFLSRTASAHPPFLGPDYGQTQQAACS